MWERIPLTKIFYILLAVVLLLVILGVRFPAKAQDLSVEQWIEIVRGEIRQLTGEEVSVEMIGSTADLPFLIDRMASDKDSFIIKNGEDHFVFSMIEVPETEGVSSKETRKIALQSLYLQEDTIYQVVSFFFGTNQSYVFFPVSGAAPVGVLIALSREVIPHQESSTVNAAGCSAWIPLTLNILRRPAEQIQICARAICEGSVANKCALTSINREVGLFATLNTLPEPPSDMNIIDGACVGDTSYQISYLNFSINALIVQMDAGFEFGGSLESHLDCESNVSVIQR